MDLLGIYRNKAEEHVNGGMQAKVSEMVKDVNKVAELICIGGAKHEDTGIRYGWWVHDVHGCVCLWV